MDDTNQSGVYSVIVTNSAGGNHVSSYRQCDAFPNLLRYRSRTSEATNTDNVIPSGHGDWFELSNLGNFPVNLFTFGKGITTTLPAATNYQPLLYIQMNGCFAQDAGSIPHMVGNQFIANGSNY